MVGAASRLVLLATGARPADGLHLLYAMVVIAPIPAGPLVPRTGEHRHAAVALMLAAFVVLGAVVYRLFTTVEAEWPRCIDAEEKACKVVLPSQVHLIVKAQVSMAKIQLNCHSTRTTPGIPLTTSA